MTICDIGYILKIKKDEKSKLFKMFSLTRFKERASIHRIPVPVQVSPRWARRWDLFASQ